MHRQGPNWPLLNHASGQARALCQRMLNWDERMRPTAQQCLGHSWFKENGTAECGEVEEAAAEDLSASLSGSQPLLTSRAPPREVVQATGDYMGRSKLEKAILLQVGSQLDVAQMGRVYEAFAVADPGRDGTVMRGDFVGALVALGVDRSDAEAYVQCVDADENGRVEYAELVSGCISILYSELRGWLWQSFCLLDLDGNGVLSRDEIDAVVTRTASILYGFLATSSLTSSHRPSSASSQDVDYRSKTPVMKDEEFAQLLDEIEAETNSRTNRECVGTCAPPAAALVLDTRPSDGGLLSSLEPQHGRDLRETPRAPAPTPNAVGKAFASQSGGLTVDEELSHLLADIANGP